MIQYFGAALEVPVLPTNPWLVFFLLGSKNNFWHDLLVMVFSIFKIIDFAQAMENMFRSVSARLENYMLHYQESYQIEGDQLPQ